MGDVKLTRGIGFREDFLIDSLTNWTADSGVAATTDGDIVAITGLTATNGYARSGLSISTSTYSEAKLRQKQTGSGGNSGLVRFTYSDASTSDHIYTTTGLLTVVPITPTAFKTVTAIKFLNSVGAPNMEFDFIFFYREELTLPAVSEPLRLTLGRTVVELPIPSREGGVLQDIGSDSARLELAGSLLATQTPNTYTANQWWNVLVELVLEGNWQWLTSDRVNYKYHIEDVTLTQEPGIANTYYPFKMRLRKVDVLSATTQTFSVTT